MKNNNSEKKRQRFVGSNRKKEGEFDYCDPSKELYLKRKIFLYADIDEESAKRIIPELLYLDSLNNNPIQLWINSPGGSVPDGLAIIDIMKHVKSRVITVVNGIAASMGGVISVAGDERWITENSVYMAHDIYENVEDYGAKVYDRVKQLKADDDKCVKILKENSNVTKKDLNKATNGELWLNPEQCLEKGIVDKII